jgi:hypothetical protein
MGDDAFEIAYRSGRSMTDKEIVDLALRQEQSESGRAGGISESASV